MNSQYSPVKSYTINIQIESLDSPESTVSFETLLRVFNKFKLSFRHFIEIEFLRNPEFVSILYRNPRVLEDFKKETELVILHLDIDKLQASIAPELPDDDTLFASEILCWKRENFEKFKKGVIFCNYHSPLSIKNIMADYSLAERVKIYKPIFDVVSYEKDYKVSILSPSGKVIGMLIPPHNITRTQMFTQAKLNLGKPRTKDKGKGAEDPRQDSENEETNGKTEEENI